MWQNIPIIVSLISIIVLLTGNFAALCLLMFKAGKWVSSIESRLTAVEKEINKNAGNS